jgi:hypothetical protein
MEYGQLCPLTIYGRNTIHPAVLADIGTALAIGYSMTSSARHAFGFTRKPGRILGILAFELALGEDPRGHHTQREGRVP